MLAVQGNLHQSGIHGIDRAAQMLAENERKIVSASLAGLGVLGETKPQQQSPQDGEHKKHAEQSEIDPRP